jgi:transcriptional regulator with XRE-family HTH domain
MTTSGKQFQIFLGKKIREYRLKMGISQEQLGKLAKVHRTYIGMIERGEKNVTIQNIYKVATALGVEVKNLIDF